MAKKGKAEISEETLKMILHYFWDGAWEEDIGADRESIIDDCEGARLYDRLVDEFNERI